jgi:hypothetical protein
MARMFNKIPSKINILTKEHLIYFKPFIVNAVFTQGFLSYRPQEYIKTWQFVAISSKLAPFYAYYRETSWNSIHWD